MTVKRVPTLLMALFMVTIFGSQMAFSGPVVPAGEIFKISGSGDYTSFELLVEKTGKASVPYKVWDFKLRQTGVISENGWGSEQWSATSLGPVILIDFIRRDGGLLAFKAHRILTVIPATNRAFLGRTALNVPGPLGFRLTYTRLTPEAQREIKVESVARRIRWQMAREEGDRIATEQGALPVYFFTPENHQVAQKEAEQAADRDGQPSRIEEVSARDFTSAAVLQLPLAIGGDSDALGESHQLLIGNVGDRVMLLKVAIEQTVGEAKTVFVPVEEVRRFDLDSGRNVIYVEYSFGSLDYSHEINLSRLDYKTSYRNSDKPLTRSRRVEGIVQAGAMQDFDLSSGTVITAGQWTPLRLIDMGCLNQLLSSQ